MTSTIGGEQSEDFRPALIRPEGTALSKPRRDKASSTSLVAALGSRSQRTRVPKGTALSVIELPPLCGQSPRWS